MITDQDNEQNTALHLAVENGHYEVVKLCLEKSKTSILPTPLTYLPHLHTYLAILQFLLKWVEVETQNWSSMKFPKRGCECGVLCFCIKPPDADPCKTEDAQL